MAIGTVESIGIGPGILYAAPVGTTEPSTSTAILPSAYREIGYTEDGSEFQYETTSEDVMVAEELDPVKIMVTGRKAAFVFQMAELTRANLALAFNMGANAVNDATLLEPPSPGSEVRIMLVWQNYDNDDGAGSATTSARWLMRQALQGAPLTTAFKKAPAKSLIPVTFKAEKPTNKQPLAIWGTSSGTLH